MRRQLTSGNHNAIQSPINVIWRTDWRARNMFRYTRQSNKGEAMYIGIGTLLIIIILILLFR
jgi:hypothetical protein